jgi:hypothetical protein
MASAISGALVKLRYGWEAVAYGTEAAVINKDLGWGKKPSITRKNNLVEALGVGDRNVQKLIQGLYEGAVSLEWIMANGYFTRLALGAAPTDAGATPYTHSYAESDTLDSATLEYYRPTDTPSVSRLLGLKCADLTITGEVRQPIKCKMNAVFANEKHYTTSANTASETEEAFHFGNANLTIGSLFADVQSFEFSLNNTTKLIPGLGSITAGKAIGNERKYGLKVRVPYETSTEFLDFLGGSSGALGANNKATGSFTISNGLTGASQRSYVVSLANLKYDSFDEAPTTDDALYADIGIKAQSCSSIVYSNGTAVAP